ncbi:MAG: RelA/SpoT family protein [Acidobacteriota bacterium]
MQFFEIIDKVLDYLPGAETALIEKAYVYAAKVHGGKSRMPGEPYLEHSLAVAGILARMRLDEESIIAGMLHGALEEQRVTLDDLKEQFGENVAGIVEGLSKLSRLDFSNRKEQQTEYMRKMVLALSRDVRVVLVKLADRLHDMRTAGGRATEHQRVLAQETLDIYAPLAARLGIDWMKQELEDRAFMSLEPEAYKDLVRSLAKNEQERKRYVEEVMLILAANLRDMGLKGRVSGRPKHLHSVYQKMLRQNLDINRIYDLTAFRMILETVKDCYEALAMVHALWEPVPGRFKDYIVKPKSNMYQSLHTTVIGPYGERMEVQIRTEEMNRVANEGIAAHWLYKEGGPKDKAGETQRFSWLRELLEWNKELRDPKALLDASKAGFYPDEVYVFTPNGDVRVFPKGSTPIDFAYDVHSEVGHRCVGARVNGKLVPLRQELQNGDTVEILTATNHRPSKDWLKLVKTGKAISRIRHWFKAEERERTIATGRELCERDFRKKGLNFNNYLNSPELLEAARSFSLKTVDDLLVGVGSRKISPLQVIGRLPSVIQEEDEAAEEVLPVERRKRSSSEEGIRVRGVNDIMIRVARCCNPVPGEPIIGYITRGKGITVHRLSCRNLNRGDIERKIDVQWDSGQDQVYPVDIMVTYSGDKGMLGVLSGVIGALDASVVDIRMESQSSGQSVCRLQVEVRDTAHLQRVLTALRGEKGVYRVYRGMD